MAGLQPEQIIVTASGDWRVLQDLRTLARDQNIPLQVREDRHFFCTVRAFAALGPDLLNEAAIDLSDAHAPVWFKRDLRPR